MAICLLTLLWLPLAQARGEDAMEYFNLGLKSSMAYKKIEYFTKALELNAKLAAAYEKRGMLYYFQKKYDKVIEDFKNCTLLDPDNAEAYRMLGMAYLNEGRYAEGIESFTRALEKDPKLTSAFSYRAEALRLNGKVEEAIADATKAIQLGGDPRVIASAYATRAKVYRQMGRQDLALANARASLLVDPRYTNYRYISAYASPEAIRKVGLIAIIGLAFVVIFKLGIPPPRKKD
jgi:tetratricopeptide (TPR) repeat protein